MSQLILKEALPVRLDVGTADSATPATEDGGVRTNYADRSLVYIGATGTAADSNPLVVLVPYWFALVQGGAAGKWYRDETQKITIASAANAVYELENRGDHLFLYVDSISGAGSKVSTWIAPRHLRYR